MERPQDGRDSFRKRPVPIRDDADDLSPFGRWADPLLDILQYVLRLGDRRRVRAAESESTQPRRHVLFVFGKMSGQRQELAADQVADSAGKGERRSQRCEGRRAQNLESFEPCDHRRENERQQKRCRWLEELRGEIHPGDRQAHDQEQVNLADRRLVAIYRQEGSPALRRFGLSRSARSIRRLIWSSA